MWSTPPLPPPSAAVRSRRVFPAGARPAVVWAVATSAVVVLTSFPVLTGYGRTAQAGNPTLVPRDYGRGVALVLGTVGGRRGGRGGQTMASST